MKLARLVARSLAFHSGAHAATLAGVLVAAAVLTGALLLGDSVRASLARAAAVRVGGVEAVLGSGERFFGVELATRLAARIPGLAVAPAIQLPAVAATSDGSRRAGDVQLLGVAPDFFALAPRPGSSAPQPEEAWLGVELARLLAVEPGSELVLRVPRPSTTTRELALVSVEEAIQPLRVRVTRVLADEDFGAFALASGAGPPANLFVAREWLAGRLGVAGRANRCFLHGVEAGGGIEAVATALRAVWELDDVGLSWRGGAEAPELASDQVFLAEPLVAALRALEPPALGLLTYFVNGITRDERTTPYSTVAALGGLDAGPPDARAGGGALRGPEVGPDEIALNDWTARDLAAEVGDEVVLSYFVLGTGRALEERTHAFRLRAIVPTEGIGADPSLAPDFPGIGDAEDCADWDPGIPLELDAIRPQDEEYWDLHRGAPKGFVALGTAHALWANRFGSFTALRVAPGQEADALGRLRTVAPGELGLPLHAVSTRAQSASDFGGLFLGLSSFIVVSALLLTALFAGFALERRAAELGVLRVSGFQRGEVARLQLGETALVCALGAALGVALGLGYTRLLLAALASVWRGAIGRTELGFALAPGSLVLAWTLAVLLALAAVALVLRRASRTRPLALLWGELAAADGRAKERGRARSVLLGLCLAIAAASLAGAFTSTGAAASGLAFLGGLAVLATGLLLVRALLARPGRPVSALALGFSNAARRPGRSLTTVALMASAVFLLVVAGASRQGPTPRDPGRDSGTGGFDFLGRTSLPVLHDLRAAEGRAFYSLDEAELAGVTLVPLRARSGDEASCLVLDQPRSPRLLGVPPASLAGRFRFAGATSAAADPWTLLDEPLGPDVVPAIVDATSLQWTIKGELGGELALVDGRGRPFRARVVATLADSILQGDVLIGERRFEERFPAEVGHRAFLIDAPPERAEALAARLSRALADEGLTLSVARERLDLLHGVQNTYLTIFQALGGLGLLLGSAGLLALVLRSAVERRGELALLRALGFSPRELRLLFLGEQGGLLWAGLAIGAVAGVSVVLPRLEAESFHALRTLGALLLAVGLAGCAWVWLGATGALRGPLLGALNRE